VWFFDASATGAPLRAHGNSASFSSTNPITWASGDELRIGTGVLHLA
jgi:hypothetical protein